MTNFHPTAVIHPDAVVHPSCKVGPYAVIGGGVRLGAGNVIGPHVVLDGDTEVGAGNRFLASCSIGAGAQISGHDGAGRLTIGDDNVFREFVTVHAGGAGVTRIGSRGLFMATSHVAHDCTIGDEVILANGATLGGHVQIGDRAQVSGLCAIHQHVRIGTLAFVAGGSIVTQDVAPYCLVQGDRARLVGLNAVGLRRAGLTPADLAGLKQAFRTIFQGSGSLAERLEAAAPESAPPAQELLAFVAATSRGVISSPRRHLAAAA